MKNIITILICFISLAGFSQEYKCGYYGKKTVEQRNKMFPFNKTKKAVLVSYSNHVLQNPDAELTDELTLDEAKVINPKIIGKYEFKLEGSERTRVYFITEEKELDVNGKNEISNILCNYTMEKQPGKFSAVGTMCYFPRNSVLFFDANDTIICCFEICFECQNTAFWPDPNGINNYSKATACEGRFDVLKHFFGKMGIVYGIKE
ncbi:hypothetical protein AAEO56_08410 [Flavobacterium sp. DGU11]|uniref:GLPGLI family protein n=1 Tax=Flavobacterium arundinis TaxID=3139143 RepID=A0ABU9HVT8_9FLAO